MLRTIVGQELEWARIFECSQLRLVEQPPRVDSPAYSFCPATPGFLPATQGQRSKDVSCLMGTCKAALRGRSHAATGEAWLKSARQSYSSTGMRVVMIRCLDP